MWKLNVGVTKKIGLPSYGSQGASVNLEGELVGDPRQAPEECRRQIRELFAAAEAAVEEQLQNAPAKGITLPKIGDAAVGEPPKFGERRVTRRQVRALELLAERGHADLRHLATYFFRVDDVLQLTRRQASVLIRRLQAQQGPTIANIEPQTQAA